MQERFKEGHREADQPQGPAPQAEKVTEHTTPAAAIYMLTSVTLCSAVVCAVPFPLWRSLVLTVPSWNGGRVWLKSGM